MVKEEEVINKDVSDGKKRKRFPSVRFEGLGRKSGEKDGGGKDKKSKKEKVKKPKEEKVKKEEKPKVKLSKEEKEFAKELRDKLLFPPPWLIVFGVVIIIFVLVYTGLSVYLGKPYGHHYLVWMATVAITFILLYLVFQFLKVVFVALISKYIYVYYAEMKFRKIPPGILENKKNDEKESQVKSLRNNNGPNYEPLTREFWRMRRIEIRNLVHTETIFYDWVFHIMFLIALYFVVMFQRHSGVYYANRAVKNLILFGEQTNTISIFRVMAYEHIFEWMEGSFLPAIVKRNEDKESRIYPRSDRVMTMDYNFKLVGNIRLRQMRATEDFCALHEDAVLRTTGMRGNGSVCYQELTWLNYDNKDYGFEWRDFLPGEKDLDDPGKVPWQYKSRREAQSWPWVGRLLTFTYGGGGYILNMGRSYADVLDAMYFTDFTDWIDKSTRVVFLEFVLANADAGLFTVVKIMFEISVAGVVIPSYKVFSAPFLYPNAFAYSAHIFFAIVFCILTIRLLLKTAGCISKHGLYTCITECWTVINMILVVLALGTAISVLGQILSIAYLRETFDNSAPQVYINFHDSMLWLQLLEGFGALTVFFATIKVEVMLGFTSIVNKSHQVLRDAWQALWAIMLKFVILAIGLIMLFHLLYGDVIEGYNNYSRGFYDLLDPEGFLESDADSLPISKTDAHEATAILYIFIAFLIVQAAAMVILAYFISVSAEKPVHNHYFLCQYIKNLCKKEPNYPKPKHYPKREQPYQVKNKDIPIWRMPYINEVRMQGMKRVVIERLSHKRHFYETGKNVLNIVISENENRPATEFYRPCGDGLVMQSKLRKLRNTIQKECDYENERAATSRKLQDEAFLKD